MKFHPIHRLRAIAWLSCIALSSASAASLQFTFTNLAPAGSISLLPGFLPLSAQDITNVSLVSADNAIAEFDSSGATPFLILPNSGAPGPESITPSTQVLGISVVPEPSVTLLGVAGLVLFMRRKSSV